MYRLFSSFRIVCSIFYQNATNHGDGENDYLLWLSINFLRAAIQTSRVKKDIHRVVCEQSICYLCFKLIFVYISNDTSFATVSVCFGAVFICSVNKWKNFAFLLLLWLPSIFLLYITLFVCLSARISSHCLSGHLGKQINSNITLFSFHFYNIYFFIQFYI